MASGAAVAAVRRDKRVRLDARVMERAARGTVLALEERKVAPDAPVDHARVAAARALPERAAVNDDDLLARARRASRQPRGR